MTHCDRNQGLNRVFLPFILIALSSFSPIASAAERSIPNIDNPAGTGILFTISDGRARLSAQNEKLSDVLAALASRTGLVAVLDREADRTLTVNIQNAGLTALLKYLLRDLNVAEVWEPAASAIPGGRARNETVLAKLYIYPDGRSAPGEDPLIIGGNPAAGNPVFIVRQDPDPNGERSQGESAGGGYRMSAASVKAYQEKKKLKSDIVLGRMIHPDSGSPAAVSSTAADSLRAYLEKKARIKAKFPAGLD